MKKLLIVGAGLYQIPAIQMAKKMGHYVIASDILPNALGFRFADKSYQISTRDYEENLKIATKEKIDGILSIVSETAVLTVARIAQKLGLPGIGIDSAIAATNKVIMNECMQKYEVPCPATAKVRNKNDAFRFIRNSHGPWVIKPTDSSGQRGLSFLNSSDEIDMAINRAKSFSTDGLAIIEQYIEGPEINATTIVIDGKVHVLSLSNRITLPPPHFGIAVHHIAPTDLPIKTIKTVENIVINSTKALGFRNGVTYPQIILSNQGPKLIEIAARVPGGFMNEVALYQSGISMIRASIMQSIGALFTYSEAIVEDFYPAVSVRFITELDLSPELEKVSKISGIREIMKLRGIKDCFLDLQIGDQIPKLFSSWGRFGAIIGVGKTRDEVIKVTENALQKIQIN